MQKVINTFNLYLNKFYVSEFPVKKIDHLKFRVLDII